MLRASGKISNKPVEPEAGRRRQQGRKSAASVVVGACSYCAEAFEATQGVEEAGVKLIDEYKRHPSFRSLLHDGYQVITF